MENDEVPCAIDPITGVCVVSRKEACPVGYRSIKASYDQQADADLWRDSIFKKKEWRYLCYSRYFPLEDGRLNNVLDSIAVLGEKDNLPAGFVRIESTIDTNEKALKKKFLAVRMVPRFSVEEAICDLIILSEMKTPPRAYMQFGMISGFLLCYRKGPVPPDLSSRINPLPAPYMLQQADVTGSRPPKGILTNAGASAATEGRRISADYQRDPKATIKLKSPSVPTQTGASLARQGSRTLSRLNSVHGLSVMDDVPFRLGPVAAGLSSRQRSAPLPPMSYESFSDIQAKYGYDFSSEKAFLASSRRNKQRSP